MARRRRRYDADALKNAPHSAEADTRKQPAYKPFVPQTIFGVIGHTLTPPGEIDHLGVDGIAGAGMLWQLAAVYLAAAAFAAVGRILQGFHPRLINLQALTGIEAFRAVMLAEIASLVLVAVTFLLIAKVSGWWVTLRQVLSGLALVHILTVITGLCVFLLLGVPGLLIGSESLVWSAITCADLLGLLIMMAFLLGLFEKGMLVTWALVIVSEIMALGTLWLTVRLAG
jgi:hypothetical protein